MKAREAKLNTLLMETNRKFSIPIFQRKYSWSEKQCQTLWNDILKLSTTTNSTGHFIGSIVCFQSEDVELPGVVKESIVIDGQQRLTTLSLIMVAIARVYSELDEDGEKVADTIKSDYLLNEKFTGEDKYKLVPTYEDKETYFALINGTENDLNNKSTHMIENFNYFYDLLSPTDKNEESIQQCKKLLQEIYVGINKLDIVYVGLDKGQDNPQIIFESMNATGEDLSQGDLLRNYLLLDANAETQKNLYETYWKPVEQYFGINGFSERFDFFLRDYLTMLEKRIVRLDMGYEEFKLYYEDKNISKEDILKNIKKFADFYSRIALLRDDDHELNSLWKELKTQRVDPANPFLMQVYNDYDYALKHNDFKLTKQDFMDIIKAINSYVYRRYIVGIPTNSLNKTFAILYNSINKQDYKNSVLATLILLESYKEFPDDEEFKNAFATKEMYTLRLKNYTLEKLENNNHLNNIIIDGTDISIEHILPETDILKPWWQEELGPDWNKLQKEYMHRIGNLTITKGVYNSQMKDYPFKKKLNVDGGIKFSNYRLSNSVVYDKDGNEREHWNIDSIIERGYMLAEQAVKIWQYPLLTEEELKPYKNIVKDEKVAYENMNHFIKMSPKIEDIFNRFDKDIMAMDDGITKLIAKYYIAYKFDYSNFTEIIIYKNSINILLDIPKELLIDNKNIAEDISDRGSWGTGNIRIKIYDDSNYDYIINLIKQSLENEKNNG